MRAPLLTVQRPDGATSSAIFGRSTPQRPRQAVMPFGYGCSSPAPARVSRDLARYGPKVKLDERWLRIAAAGLMGQAAASSSAIASVSWHMSDDAVPCIASATITAALVGSGRPTVRSAGSS